MLKSKQVRRFVRNTVAFVVAVATFVALVFALSSMMKQETAKIETENDVLRQQIAESQEEYEELQRQLKELEANQKEADTLSA